MNEYNFKPGDWVERRGWVCNEERMGLIIAVVDHMLTETTVAWRELWVLYPNMSLEADMDEKWRLQSRTSEPRVT